MFNFCKVSKVVGLGVLLLSGTCLQAMDKPDAPKAPRRALPPTPTVAPAQPNGRSFPRPLPAAQEVSNTPSKAVKVVSTEQPQADTPCLGMRLLTDDLWHYLGSFLSLQSAVVTAKAYPHSAKILDSVRFLDLSPWSLKRSEMFSRIFDVFPRLSQNITSVKMSYKLSLVDNISDVFSRFPQLKRLTTSESVFRFPASDYNNFTGLTGLSFNGVRDYNFCADHLSVLTNLENLNLQTCITKPLVSTLTRLKNLSLWGDVASDDQLQKFTALEDLTLFHCDSLSENSVGCLTNLKDLRLYSTKQISDGALQHLTNLTKLTVSFHESLPSAVLQNLTNLRKLHLSNTDTLSEAVEKGESPFAKLTGLRDLKMDGKTIIPSAGK